ncbi:MAG: hypothetical protein WBM74_00055 [Polyangiales bacterium]
MADVVAALGVAKRTLYGYVETEAALGERVEQVLCDEAAGSRLEIHLTSKRWGPRRYPR